MPGTSGPGPSAGPPSDDTGPSWRRGASTTTLPTGSTRNGSTATVGSAAGSGLLVWWRRHAVFLVVLLVGMGWRILVQAAFKPALIVAESGSHLGFLTRWTPSAAHSVGYGVLELAPLSWWTNALGPVVAVQHLMGLATGIVIYVLLLRWGVWRWLAAVATVPVLWDPYELASEHLVLPDTLFVLLVAVALLMLGWRGRPTLGVALGGGVVLGAATTVRPVGAPLVVAAVVFMVLAATTWRGRLAGALVVVVGFAFPVLSYMAWYHHAHGEYAVTQTQAARGSGVDASRGRPQADGPLRDFAVLAEWSHADGHAYRDVATWKFSSYVPPETWPRGGRLYAQHGSDELVANQPAADALVAYQTFTSTPGPLLLGGLLVALFAGMGFGRARASGMRAVCLLTGIVPAVILFGALSSADSSWRNQLPGLALWPAAGALGLTALLRGRRAPAARRSQLDDTDRAALAAFRVRYGDAALAPVVVVIAAYNEAVGLPRVLSSMPPRVCGLAADVVVVDDGSTDGTAAAANDHGGAYLVVCPANRGQGAAMRLGYRVARNHGARYIITTDADAQYDTGDFPTVLAPVLDGSADFVTGSRRLGRQHTVDRFRRAGVYVFAWIVSALTGESLTDTSFGLRAMRAEVSAEVTLNQPQYQSAELLIGAHSHGYRIVEVPATMHLRASGSTKKGANLLYGTRYARVVLGTWWREGCPVPVTELAPSMRGTEAQRLQHSDRAGEDADSKR